MAMILYMTFVCFQNSLKRDDFKLLKLLDTIVLASCCSIATGSDDCGCW